MLGPDVTRICWVAYEKAKLKWESEARGGRSLLTVSYFVNPSGEGAYALLGRSYHRKSHRIKYDLLLAHCADPNGYDAPKDLALSTTQVALKMLTLLRHY
jgi:hypothetical protein